MKHLITMIMSVVTLFTVGCNPTPTMYMQNVEIEQIEIHEDSVSIFISEGYDNQDIWVHISSDTVIYTQLDDVLQPTDLEVGDVLIQIRIDEIMESYPLQTNALEIEVAS